MQYFLLISIPICCSTWMDNDPKIWRLLFSLFGLFYLLNLISLFFFKTKTGQEETIPISRLNGAFFLPLKSAWKLCREDTHFTKYLLIYFLGGIGIIMTQPVLPIYFKESLHLSYQELTLAISVCKGLAFILSSGLWASWLQKQTIYAITAYVNIFCCLFFLSIFASHFGSYWVLVAYGMYGMMQSGCELIFNMSGPIFSGKRESTEYSGVNLVSIGFRGAIFPFLGQILFMHTDITTILLLSGFFSFATIFYSLFLDKEYLQIKQEAYESVS